MPGLKQQSDWDCFSSHPEKQRALEYQLRPEATDFLLAPFCFYSWNDLTKIRKPLSLVKEKNKLQSQPLNCGSKHPEVTKVQKFKLYSSVISHTLSLCSWALGMSSCVSALPDWAAFLVWPNRQNTRVTVESPVICTSFSVVRSWLRNHQCPPSQPLPFQRGTLTSATPELGCSTAFSGSAPYTVRLRARNG